ncbi:unnamed protein product [Arabidopsis arenosa]|uniref:Uncharacterized protein n=1 Tax=Arabidopsis arenosa TaxID=38785 RepID=A0A8S2B2Q4_ARAAE|nr:unnamed protein product [Arabidopsis arenosa]
MGVGVRWFSLGTMRGYDRRLLLSFFFGSQWWFNGQIYVLRLVLMVTGSISDLFAVCGSGSMRGVSSNRIWLRKETEVSVASCFGSMVERLVFVSERESESCGCTLELHCGILQLSFSMGTAGISISETESENLWDSVSGLNNVNEDYLNTELMKDLIGVLIGAGLQSQRFEWRVLEGCLVAQNYGDLKSGSFQYLRASLERIMDILALVWYHSGLNEDRKRLGCGLLGKGLTEKMDCEAAVDGKNAGNSMVTDMMVIDGGRLVLGCV